MRQLNNERFFILGAQGQLGKAFVEKLTSRGYSLTAPLEADANIIDTEGVCAQIEQAKATFLINCAAYNAVDEAETKKEMTFEVNARAVGRLAKYCQQKGIFLVHFSSDYVFDGKKTEAYTEEDSPNPLSCYGKSKLEGDREVLAQAEGALVFRLSWLIGGGRQNFLSKLLDWAKMNSVIRVATDEVSVPTFVETVVDFTLLSLEKGLRGLYHLTNSGSASRYELAQFFIREMGLVNEIQPASMEDFPRKATRPRFSVMSNQRLSKALGKPIPTWQAALKEHVQRIKRNDSVRDKA